MNETSSVNDTGISQSTNDTNPFGYDDFEDRTGIDYLDDFEAIE